MNTLEIGYKKSSIMEKRETLWPIINQDTKL